MKLTNEQLLTRRLHASRCQLRILQKSNRNLRHMLQTLAYMFDADADGGFMFRWHNENQMRREIRRANRILGRDDVKIGRRHP